MKRLLVVLIITLIGLSISPPVQAQSSCQFTFVSNTAGTGWFSITYSADNYTMLTSIQYSNHNPFGDDIPFTITGIEANSVDIYSGSTYVSDIVVIDVADVVLSAGQHVTIKTYTPDYVQGTILPLCQTAPPPTPTPTPGATLTPLAGINNAI